MDIQEFENRKQDHLRLALDPKNDAFDAPGGSGLHRIILRHEALPELDFGDIQLDTDFFGYSAASPLFISSMTAGHKDGEALNQTLIAMAAANRWPMGVGSQRRELNDPEAQAEWKRVREATANSKNACLFSNLGLSQIIDSKTDAIKKVIDSLEAHALIVHTNPLQEALQPEGTPSFAGGLRALERLADELPVPVILKETGCGFSESTLRRLAETNISVVDISGFGGTHWGRIEGGRAHSGSQQQIAAQTFADWGNTTVDSLLAAQAVSEKKYAVWASGGIRTGLDAAKCLALGADAVGFAKPALVAAGAGPETLQQWMQQMQFELKIALFCTGARTPAELKRAESWQKI